MFHIVSRVLTEITRSPFNSAILRLEIFPSHIFWEISYLPLRSQPTFIHLKKARLCGREDKRAREPYSDIALSNFKLQASPSTSIINMPHTVRSQLSPYYYYTKHWHELPHCSTSNFLRLASKAARTTITNTWRSTGLMKASRPTNLNLTT